jgi:hypothetical protein
VSRADLLALTPESLAALANVGLVKRAQRELAEGSAPELSEEPDGTVVGVFKDGVTTRLVPRKPLKECPCTCGAAGTCRHRVAAVLAYKAWQAHAQPSVQAGGPTWSPREIDDATLEHSLGVKVLERARAALRRGLIVTVEIADVPTAKLPSCTVRFLVPRDVAYAKCDCALAGGGCEHLVLAVWAFRAAPEDSASAVVSLGEASADTGVNAGLDAAHALARDIVRAGIATSSPSPARFARLRKSLEAEGVTWLHGLVVDLELALEGYHKRSALHGTREIAGLLTELAARVRAARRRPGELPARFILGQDEAAETRLDHVRLVSLGARVRADERTRFADIYLADPDTALVLVMSKRWDFEPDKPLEEGPELGRRPIASGISLRALAHGQLVSKVISRQANHTIILGRSSAAQTSVTPQRGDWGGLPAPLLITNLSEHERRVATQPPRLLRPRVLADSVHVVQVAAIDHVTYSSAEQVLTAILRDASGFAFELVVRHRRAAPHALEAVATALQAEVRFVAGELTRRGLLWSMTPMAIAGEQLVVPDLAGPVATPFLPGGRLQALHDPLDAILASAASSLEESATWDSRRARAPRLSVWPLPRRSSRTLASQASRGACAKCRPGPRRRRATKPPKPGSTHRCDWPCSTRPAIGAPSFRFQRIHVIESNRPDIRRPMQASGVSRLSAILLLCAGSLACGGSASKPVEHPAQETAPAATTEAPPTASSAGSEAAAPVAADLGPDLCSTLPPTAPELIRYEARSGRFAVLLPRLPSDAVADDKETDDSVFVSETGRVYNARHCEMPAATMMLDARAVIDKLRDGAVEGGNGTLDGERFVSCNGSPGREFVVRTKDGHAACRVRMFLVRNHFFMATATGPRGVEDEAVTSAFLDSFRPILPK